MREVAPFSLVVPCYNESKNLQELIESIERALLRSHFPEEKFELLLVDNGSNDGTQEVLQSTKCKFLRTLRVPVNRGYGHGLHEGLKAARGSVIATMHADLQIDPLDVFRAYELYREKARDGSYTLVKGKRYGRRFLQWLFSRLFDWTTLVLCQKALHEINAQPKVFSKDIVTWLNLPPKDFRFDLYLLLRAKGMGVEVAAMPVRTLPRISGRSHWAHSIQSKVRTIYSFLQFLATYRWKTLIREMA